MIGQSGAYLFPGGLSLWTAQSCLVSSKLQTKAGMLPTLGVFPLTISVPIGATLLHLLKYPAKVKILPVGIDSLQNQHWEINLFSTKWKNSRLVCFPQAKTVGKQLDFLLFDDIPLQGGHLQNTVSLNPLPVHSIDGSNGCE